MRFLPPLTALVLLGGVLAPAGTAHAAAFSACQADIVAGKIKMTSPLTTAALNPVCR
ncbi:MAG: hypothetical protein ABIS86_08360 [Streptosporangiaceae bacterium]